MQMWAHELATNRNVLSASIEGEGLDEDESVIEGGRETWICKESLPLLVRMG